MRNWRKPGEPSFQERTTELAKVASFGKNRMEKYVAKWGDYLQYITAVDRSRSRGDHGAYCCKTISIYFIYFVL